MSSVNILLVTSLDDTLIVLQEIRRVEIAADGDYLLENVRNFVRQRYGGTAHALGWSLTGDAISQREGPFLVVHVDACCGINAHLFAFMCPRDDSAGFQAADLAEPWSKPGWLLDTEHWIRKTLSQTEDISQVRVGSAGTVLRITTTCAPCYYLKSVPYALRREVLLLQLLNERLPNTCARMINCRPDEITHITEEIAGRPLSSLNDIHSWKAALRDVARFQIRSIQHLEAMRAIGVPYRSLAELNRNLRKNIHSLINAQENSIGELDEEEKQRIEVLIESASRDCEILNDCNIPETVINTDMNQSNIFITVEGATILIDWTFARISHPFFTLHGTLFGLDDTDRCPAGNRETLAREYLAQWQPFNSSNVLVRGYQAASRLVFVQVALNVFELAQVFQDIGPSCFTAVLRESLEVYNSRLNRPLF